MMQRLIFASGQLFSVITWKIVPEILEKANTVFFERFEWPSDVLYDVSHVNKSFKKYLLAAMARRF